MKLLSASFFLAMGLGIGTLISTVNAGTASGPRVAPAQAAAYAHATENQARPDVDDSAR